MGWRSNYEVLSGPLALCPACPGGQLHDVYRRSAITICGVPVVPTGSKSRLACLQCGFSERRRDRMRASISDHTYSSRFLTRRANCNPYTRNNAYDFFGYQGSRWGRFSGHMDRRPRGMYY